MFDDQSLISVNFTNDLRFFLSFIKICGLNWTALDYSTLCRRQKHIDIAIGYQKCSNGLYVLMDSTALKSLGEGEWKKNKHQPENRRRWHKLHIDIDAKILQILEVQLTTNNIIDSQILSDLLDHILLEEQIYSLYTDGAYDTKYCR